MADQQDREPTNLVARLRRLKKAAREFPLDLRCCVGARARTRGGKEGALYFQFFALIGLCCVRLGSVGQKLELLNALCGDDLQCWCKPPISAIACHARPTLMVVVLVVRLAY